MRRSTSLYRGNHLSPQILFLPAHLLALTVHVVLSWSRYRHVGPWLAAGLQT